MEEPSSLITAHAIQQAIDDQQRKEQWSPRVESAAPAQPSSLSPETTAMLGAMMDTAGTYKALKGGRVENDQAVKFLGNSPAATAAGVGMTALGYAAVRALVRKKWPRLADASAANQGAEQMALGSANFASDPSAPSANDQWFSKALAAVMNRK